MKTLDRRGFPAPLSWIIGLLLLIILFSSNRALAWGPITHTAINQEASAGTMGREFAMGGHSPDMISLRHVVTGDSRYDYAHNFYGSNKEPLFGQKIIRVYKNSKHKERYGGSDKEFAYGWAGHQIADGFTHGASGYSETKETFQKLPEAFRKDLNHGVVELIVDAIVTEEVFRGDPALYAPSHADLIHEGSVIFYNEVKMPSNSHTIPRRNVISCGAAEQLTRRWGEWLVADEFLAKLASRQSWFKEAREFYADYKAPFEASVSSVRGFLKNFRAERGFHLVNLFIFSDVAYGAEEERSASAAPESVYFRFVSRLAEEAKKLGGGKLTDEALRQALSKVVKEDSESGSEEVRVWAKLMEELYLKDNHSFKEIVQNVENYKSRPPAGTNRSRKQSWALLILAVSLVGLASGWLIWAIRDGRR